MSTSRLAALDALLQTDYAIDVRALHHLDGDETSDRALFRVELPDGQAALLRAYRSERPVPDWLSGCGVAAAPAWLADRAATLAALERWGYGAPRVILTRTGALTNAAADWSVLLTTYVPGQIQNATARTLEQLGAALGQLHRISIPHLASGEQGEQPVGRSWLHVDNAVPAASRHYEAVAAAVPPRWRALHHNLLDALTQIALSSSLPSAVLHGDAWAGNAVQRPDGTVALIDWELAGRGLAILDLGRLLLFCHEDVEGQTDARFTPAAWRVEAVMKGYCSERVPTAPEQALLVAAIRYGIAIEAATEFPRAMERGWDADADERLAVREHWFVIGAEIADLARACVAPHTP